MHRQLALLVAIFLLGQAAIAAAGKRIKKDIATIISYKMLSENDINGKILHASVLEAKQEQLYHDAPREFMRLNTAVECAVTLIEEQRSLAALETGAFLLYKMLEAAKNKNFAALENYQRSCTQAAAEASTLARENYRKPSDSFVESLYRQLSLSNFSALFLNEFSRRLSRGAVCVQRQRKLKLSAFFGFQVGYAQQTCESGFGRRYKMFGPLLGAIYAGIGCGYFYKKEIKSFADDNHRTLIIELDNGDLALGKGLSFEDFSLNPWMKTQGLGAHISAVEISKVFAKTTMLPPNFLPLYEQLGVVLP